MFQARFPSESPQRWDLFGASRAQLAEAIAGPVARQEPMRQALAGLERGLRQRIMLEDMPDGRSPEIDSTRASLARQADQLRHNLDALLAQTVALREAVARGADTNALRRSAEDLLVDLDANESAERDLVLESVNTDLGVGD
jgi:hypothetical protein